MKNKSKISKFMTQRANNIQNIVLSEDVNLKA